MTRRDDTGCDLARQECTPCRGGSDPLKGAELEQLAAQLPQGWQVIDEHHLEKGFKFRNFREALAFVNRVGELAEELGHHPEIQFGWGHTTVTVWTHKIGGLHKNDFIFAARADGLLPGH